MPVIRYTVRLPDDEFSEQDTFRPTDNPEGFIRDEIIAPLNRARVDNGEPQMELVKVEVTNPFLHEHSWRRTHVDRINLRSHYLCDRCGITGWKAFNVAMNRETTLSVTRDDKYKNDRKFALCRDPLKELPKKLNFG